MAKNDVVSYSLSTIQRLPSYLRALNDLASQNEEYVTTITLGKILNINPMSIKKDLAIISSKEGVPHYGFKIPILISDIETILGYDNTKDAVIIGVGHLGQALLSYPGFTNYGVNICLGFDIDSNLIGQTIHGVTIMPLTKLEDLIERLHIHIAIICVPKDAAQEIANRLSKTTIRAIWNWAPINLAVPDNIVLKNEDIASSLAILTSQMEQSMKRNK